MIMDLDFERVKLINLEPIVERLVRIHGWPRKTALQVEEQYRNYLFLKKKYGDQYSLPPSIEIDEFWHNHILHTKKYHQDCLLIFGEYLHHNPHQEQGTVAISTLERKFEEETQMLHMKEFGDYIYQTYPKLVAKMRLY